MRSVRGVVMEAGHRTVVVYTENGEFREIRTPKRAVRVGEAVDLPDRPSLVFTYRTVAAAVLLLALLGGMAWPWAGLRSAAASQVFVDANGAVQLSVDKNNRVIKATPLNDMARPWVERLRLVGRDVYEAVRLVASRSAASIENPSRGNVVMVSVVGRGKPGTPGVSEDKVRDTLHTALTRQDYEGYLVVNRVDASMEEQASRMGMSPNRYLMLRSSLSRGISLDARKVREAELGQVIQEGRVPMEQVFNRGCWLMSRAGAASAARPTLPSNGQAGVEQPVSAPSRGSSWSCGPWQERRGASEPQASDETVPEQ